MGTIIETSVYGLWWGKQTAKGTANTAPTWRGKQVAGDFNIPRDDGSENWSDLSKYGNATDWVNSVLGNGEPGIEATPEEMSNLLWLFHGAETTSAVTGPPAKTKHTFTPSTGRGFWATFFKRIGQTTPQRQQFNDSLVTRIQIEGSTANKAVRITPRIISVDPGEVKVADPSQALPTKPPFLYTDGTGTFTIDGVVFKGQTQFTIVIDDDLSPVFGDDILPYDFVNGRPVVTLGVTFVFDGTEALGEYNKLVYGSASPAGGTKPLKTIPAYGSYGFTLTRRDNAGVSTGDKFQWTATNTVKWTVPDAPGPAPDGGTPEVSLAGALRNAASPMYTIAIDNDAAAHTV